MPAFAVALPLSPADTAHAAAQVYTVSLAATVPIVLAAVVAAVLRRGPAGTRAVVWRAAVIALSSVWLGQLLPVHWIAWVVPGALASPLVALGRAQVTSTEHGWFSFGVLAPGTLLAVYWFGVLALVGAAISGWVRARALVNTGRVPRGAMLAALGEVRCALGVRRSIRLRLHDGVRVPMACGLIRPSVLLPMSAETWDEANLRAVLLHEVAHVRSYDVAFAMVARVACALFWLHPGAWWLARRLYEESELACDDRVLAAGVRPSAYAGLLADLADEVGRRTPVAAVALVPKHGLRARLVAVLDTSRDRHTPRRSVLVASISLAFVLSMPLGMMRLAPTRGVLTALMRDARWDSRAYAVLGLAQRSDSVAAARAAAVADPSPRVRAWARYALGASGDRLRATSEPGR